MIVADFRHNIKIRRPSPRSPCVGGEPVCDGSRDNTWSLICKFHTENKFVRGVNLAGNVGHQNALWAGLTVAKDHADMLISIDADLQDDVNAIRDMIWKHQEGCDIVYGVRNERKTDSWFKRNSALVFYRVMEIMGTKTIYPKIRNYHPIHD